MKFISLEKLEREINNPETYKKYVQHGDHYQKIINEIRKALKNKI